MHVFLLKHQLQTSQNGKRRSWVLLVLRHRIKYVTNCCNRTGVETITEERALKH